MNLSFLIYTYFPYGGQQRDFLRILNECLSRGNQVTVYTRQWQGDIPEGVDLVIVPVQSTNRIKLYREFTEWVGDALSKAEDSLIVGFNKMPLLDVYFAADPCFAEKAETQRGIYYRFTPRFKHFKSYEESLFGKDSKAEIMLLSPQQRRDFAKHYPYCESRFHDVPPGIDRDRRVDQRDTKARAELRKDFGIQDDQFLILQIGSGFRVKGVDRSLKALASLDREMRDKCRFILIGQDKPSRFQRLANRLGLKDLVTILPGRDDIPRFLAAADLLLHPAYMESAGYVLLEATIAGLPVLTTATCGYAFHIEKAGSGEVCSEPFQQQDLDSRLKDMLLQLPDADWSASGLEYGKNDELYSLPQFAAQLIEEAARKKQAASS
jgi:UDP-glucose:(heptosyl)LPS alpha-1,3-glucosyltransferase